MDATKSEDQSKREKNQIITGNWFLPERKYSPHENYHPLKLKRSINIALYKEKFRIGTKVAEIRTFQKCLLELSVQFNKENNWDFGILILFKTWP